MCGIAGFAGGVRSRASSEAELRAMCDAILHRGPDEDGYHVAAHAGLGMRRLSIIDVAGGTQPIANEDDTSHVVFNGEIYNHRQLRAVLRTRGHRFVTRSDTETLVHLYEDLGERMVDELRGMFGFAIWDERRERLLLGRDRFGIKPLYYWTDGEGIVFASELRSLLALPRFPRRLDRRAIASFFSFGYVPDPLSVFENVRKLPPGHVLSWERATGARVRQYWNPNAIPAAPAMREEEAAEELRRLLVEAVECHLESEVPLGAFLSGGIDSSTVVAIMARAMDRPVKTFSIGFSERAFDESRDARLVARALRTDHHELVVQPDADALVHEVIRSFDEPFADSSALPTYLVAKLAREHVTVSLSGDGGDELFGGYERYAQMEQRADIRSATARRVLRAVGRRAPAMLPGRNRLIDLGRTRQGRYAATVALPLPINEGGVARPEIASLLPRLDGLLATEFADATGREFASQMMSVDLRTYLPGDILTKVDRTTMAVSLEARVPLLDHRLAEFALSLPTSFKLRDGQGKRILRRAIADLVPAHVLGKRKQGFGVPLGRWFRHELRYRVEELLRPSAAIYEFAEPSAVRRLALDHQVGRRDHSATLWRLLALELWLGALSHDELSRPLAGGEALDVIIRRAVTA